MSTSRHWAVRRWRFCPTGKTLRCSTTPHADSAASAALAASCSAIRRLEPWPVVSWRSPWTRQLTVNTCRCASPSTDVIAYSGRGSPLACSHSCSLRLGVLAGRRRIDALRSRWRSSDRSPARGRIESAIEENRAEQCFQRIGQIEGPRGAAAALLRLSPSRISPARPISCARCNSESRLTRLPDSRQVAFGQPRESARTPLRQSRS